MYYYVDLRKQLIPSLRKSVIGQIMSFLFVKRFRSGAREILGLRAGIYKIGRLIELIIYALMFEIGRIIKTEFKKSLASGDIFF